jgi:hypothetical protein
MGGHDCIFESIECARKRMYVLTTETAFSGAILERSQYAPSSNSSIFEDEAVGEGSADEVSVTFAMMVCTSFSVDDVELSPSPFSFVASVRVLLGRTISVASAIMNQRCRQY